eukprot:TRINITY_DN29456_c0_g1_i1.p1 TRINITY_DN29456_c0_g1~~TRINITY_DN29456_c0_g1_i1.p1  ORF type:complete len:238 (-),score=43.40 TRINITY_DN29456_c0_g1_i1:137-850(-)
MGSWFSSAASFDPEPEFPTLVARANAEVEEHFQGMVNAHHKLKALRAAQESAFKTLSKPLLQECQTIHDRLQNMAGRAPVCHEAQYDQLPKLFESQADGKIGAISGCAVTENLRDINSATCRCALGDASEGCREAESDADHTLICTHIRQGILPQMKIHYEFAKGRRCSIDSMAKFNKPLLPASEPKDFKLPDTDEFEAQASAAPPLLALLGPPPSLAPAPRGRKRRCRTSHGRSFL